MKLEARTKAEMTANQSFMPVALKPMAIAFSDELLQEKINRERSRGKPNDFSTFYLHQSYNALFCPLMLLKKEGNLYSFIHAKCPHCHHGDMFVNKNPYALKDMSKMPKNCSVCGRSYFPETGFYWGAMYMSYMLTVFSSIFNVIFVGLIFGFKIYPLIIGNTLLLIILYPLFFRYARVMWLQFNTPFSKEAFQKAEALMNGERFNAGHSTK